MDKFYTVKKGDTLSEIGRLFNIDWNQLAAHNQIDNPNRISIGQVIMVPDPSPAAGPVPVMDPPMPPAPVAEIGRIEPYSYNVEMVPPEQAPPSPFSGLEKRGEGSGGNQPFGELTASKDVKSYKNPTLVGEPMSMERLKAVGDMIGTPEFWAEFLEKNMPTAMGAASGPGAGMIRAASGLKRMADETSFMKDRGPDDAMAKFRFKNMRYRNNTQDPNYENVRDPGSEMRMDQVGNRPLAMGNKAVGTRSGNQMLETLTGEPSSTWQTGGGQAAVAKRTLTDLTDKASKTGKNSSSHAKEHVTTVERTPKEVADRLKEMADILEQFMTVPIQEPMTQ